jgi:undecaprenyl diphosphate synthase
MSSAAGDSAPFAYSGLERIFHERGRLAVCTCLVANPDGMRFTDLQDACGLTDGNLNRHLHALAEVAIVTTERVTGRGRPATIVRITHDGRRRFLAYVDELAAVIEHGLRDAAALGHAVAGGAAPRHVAIIMDGNRRWAVERGLPVIEGHRRGVRTLQRIVTAAIHHRIEVLTVFAFSEENWQREAGEVTALMDLALAFARREARALARNGVRVRTIGRRDRIATSLRNELATLEERTAPNTRLTLNLAIDYGARHEMCEAVRTLAREIVAGRLKPGEIDDEQVAGRLWTAGQPDPDLLIRTGGDLRLSNFLLFQCAYTELWATPTPWPAFDGAAFSAALDSFGARQRRFGR